MIGDPITGERYHAVEIATLRLLLEQVPDGSTLQPNDVKNLAILSPDGEFVGYVDLGAEEVRLV